MSEFHGHPDQHFGYISYSQHGDDFMLLNLLNLLGIEPTKTPTWLDLGAHHPMNISNTKLLYDRGYRGVNVEANPVLFGNFLKDRPCDVNVNIGVGPVSGVKPFFMYSDTSGRNTFSPDEVKSLEGRMTVRDQFDLKMKTLGEIVYDYCANSYPIILLSDIEGLDFDVLSSLPAFNDPENKIGLPEIICVETRQGPEPTRVMTSMLTNKGYFVYCRMGENLFFIRADKFHKVFSG